MYSTRSSKGSQYTNKNQRWFLRILEGQRKVRRRGFPYSSRFSQSNSSSSSIISKRSWISQYLSSLCCFFVSNHSFQVTFFLGPSSSTAATCFLLSGALLSPLVGDPLPGLPIFTMPFLSRLRLGLRLGEASAAVGVSTFRRV